MGSETYGKRALSDIAWVVWHHSAVAVDSSAQAIAEYHVGTLGWPGIGYSWLIHWDGTIEYVGDMKTIRYQVAGRNNETMGICIPGDWRNTDPPQAALEASRQLWRYLKTTMPWLELKAHREVALPGYATECPGSTWPRWRERIL